MTNYNIEQTGYKLDLEGTTPKILPLYTVQTKGGKEIAECKTRYLAEKVVRGLEREYDSRKLQLATEGT